MVLSIHQQNSNNSQKSMGSCTLPAAYTSPRAMARQKEVWRPSKISQECWRSLSVTTVIQSHPTTMVQPVSSWTVHGTSNLHQCISTIWEGHSKLVVRGEVLSRWLPFQDQTEVRLRQMPPNQTPCRYTQQHRSMGAHWWSPNIGTHSRNY